MTRQAAHTFTFGAVSALSGLLIGADGGMLGISLLHMRHGAGLDDAQISWLTPAAYAGMMASTLCAALLADAFGRKKALLAGIAVFALGLAMATGLADFRMLLAGRALQGVGLGIFCGVVPIFLGESLPTGLRGAGTALFGLCATLGVFAAMAAGDWFYAQLEPALRAAAGNVAQTMAIEDRAWRRLFLAQAPLLLMLAAATLTCAESPRWLFRQGRREASLAALLRGRDGAQAQLELAEMEELARLSSREHAGDAPWRRHYVLPLLLALGIFTFNAALGSTVINAQSVFIFSQAGLGDTLAADASKWMALVAFLGAACGLVLVNRHGRKTLMIWGLGVAIAALCAGIAVLGVTQSRALGTIPPETTGWIIFACVAAYQFALAIGPGACGWLLVSELLPTRIRSVGMGAGILLGSLVNIGMLASFLGIFNRFGLAGPWILWGASAAVYLELVLLLLPETRGKTLEEIEAMFAPKTR